MFQIEVVGKIKTNGLCSMFIYFGNHAVYEKMCKNIVNT